MGGSQSRVSGEKKEVGQVGERECLWLRVGAAGLVGLTFRSPLPAVGLERGPRRLTRASEAAL